MATVPLSGGATDNSKKSKLRGTEIRPQMYWFQLIVGNLLVQELLKIIKQIPIGNPGQSQKISPWITGRGKSWEGTLKESKEKPMENSVEKIPGNSCGIPGRPPKKPQKISGGDPGKNPGGIPVCWATFFGWAPWKLLVGKIPDENPGFTKNSWGPWPKTKKSNELFFGRVPLELLVGQNPGLLWAKSRSCWSGGARKNQRKSRIDQKFLGALNKKYQADKENPGKIPNENSKGNLEHTRPGGQHFLVKCHRNYWSAKIPGGILGCQRPNLSTNISTPHPCSDVGLNKLKHKL